MDDATVTTASPERDDEPFDRHVIAGRYRVDGMLGAGGMGVVYLVRDLSLDEDVALKVLRVNAPDGDALSAFKGEVKLARRVTHRNVARVFDFGEHAGRYFLTMEWVDGSSLKAVRDQGPVPLPAALATALAVAQGLGAVHEAGIVHRDLKPHNVLLTRSGAVKLTDFGVAVVATDGARAVAGTPVYMAPELFRGQQASVASDLYAFALVILELVTGERLAARAHAGEPIERLVPRALPGAVREVLVGCLATDPRARGRAPSPRWRHAWPPRSTSSSTRAVSTSRRRPAARSASAWRRSRATASLRTTSSCGSPSVRRWRAGSAPRAT